MKSREELEAERVYGNSHAEVVAAALAEARAEMTRTERGVEMSEITTLFALAKDLGGKTEKWWNERDPVDRVAFHAEAQEALRLLTTETRRRGRAHAERVERFRRALMDAHADDWDMETISEAAHICAEADRGSNGTS